MLIANPYYYCLNLFPIAGHYFIGGTIVIRFFVLPLSDKSGQLVAAKESGS